MNAPKAGLWMSALLLLHTPAAAPQQSSAPNAGYKTIEIPFTSHDGHGMLGKLTLPATGGPFPVVVFVQTAEAATADMRVQGPQGPVDFFDIRGIVLASVLNDMKPTLKFMMTDGMFAQHQGHWDANRDGTITATEFEADPRGIRKQMSPGVTLASFDRTGDGAYTVEDARANAKPATDAVDSQNMEILNAWVKAVAIVDIPAGWIRDHLNHSATEAFLTRLKMPVGFFHYFPGLGHDLGGMQYFARGVPSPGFAAVLEYVKRQVASK